MIAVQGHATQLRGTHEQMRALIADSEHSRTLFNEEAFFKQRLEEVLDQTRSEYHDAQAQLRKNTMLIPDSAGIAAASARMKSYIIVYHNQHRAHSVLRIFQ